MHDLTTSSASLELLLDGQISCVEECGSTHWLVLDLHQLSDLPLALRELPRQKAAERELGECVGITAVRGPNMGPGRPRKRKTKEHSVELERQARGRRHDLFNYLGWKFLSLLVKYSRSDLFSYYTSFLESLDPSYKKPQPPFTSTCIRDLMENMKYAFGRMYVTNFFKDADVLNE
ncbi:hypothetical protein HPB47_015035, partial [Ixodes persulcatus]